MPLENTLVAFYFQLTENGTSITFFTECLKDLKLLKKKKKRITASLNTNATANPEPTTFTWTIGGSAVNMSVNPRISLSSDNKELTITNVNRKDSGEYKCEATNRVGKTASRVATVDVQCK